MRNCAFDLGNMTIAKDLKIERDGYYFDRGFSQYHKTVLVTRRAIHKRTERFILMQENCGNISEKVLKLFVKERTFHDKGCGSNLFTYICSSIFLPSLLLFFMKYSLKAKYGARMRFINNTMKCKDGTGNKGRATTVRDLHK